MEEEMGVMQPQAKECSHQKLEATRNGFFPRASMWSMALLTP